MRDQCNETLRQQKGILSRVTPKNKRMGMIITAVMSQGVKGKYSA